MRKNCKLCTEKFNPKLIRVTDLLLIIDKAIRGGFTQAAKRYAKANNKYMGRPIQF